jgi:hypothetical protein
VNPLVASHARARRVGASRAGQKVARGQLLLALLVASLSLPSAADGAAATRAQDVATRACTALTARVDAVAGRAPMLLRSYDDASGAGEPAEPTMRTAAFVYDNSLAVIALLACDRRAQALRIAEALRVAATTDARLRNVYRAGLVGDKALANGWWDARQNRWLEDAYQQGSATGNVAWAGLALLAAFDATHDARWRDAAQRLASWVVEHTRDESGSGFSGGIDGFDAQPVKVTWKSTEHNIDLVALFGRLARAGAREGVPAHGAARPDWAVDAQNARRFVDSQWDPPSGHFFVGTLPDGKTPNRVNSGLDVELWPQLLPNAPPEWRRAIEYAEREHAVPGGFDFNTDRDGLWLEGTAQAALVYRTIGREADADRLLATIARQFSAGGLVYATREPRITTGLAIGAASVSADFYYYRLPHIGATAWAALAATGRNPFAEAPPQPGIARP